MRPKFIFRITLLLGFIVSATLTFAQDIDLAKYRVVTQSSAYDANQCGHLVVDGSKDTYWESFWNMTAFLSIILAIMNVLPIPALDGGHVMFLLFEMVTGRKPGESSSKNKLLFIYYFFWDVPLKLPACHLEIRSLEAMAVAFGHRR